MLFRHGIAIDRTDPRCPADPDRGLTARGIERTHRAARGLARLGVVPSLVLTSPWRRAVETARIAAAELGVAPAALVETEALLPFADPGELADLLRARDEPEVLCAGHEPHLTATLGLLVAGGPAPSLGRLKKAGAACVETPAPGQEPGVLLWLHTAGALRREAGA